MSRQLATSAAFAVFTMAAFALFAGHPGHTGPASPTGLAEMQTGATVDAAAPAFGQLASALFPLSR